jgi:dihydroflavonol-4-reductase
MRLFVTGATGFLGGYLMRRLATSPHQCLCLVRDVARARALEREGVTLVAGDVTDRPGIARAIEGCEGVLHLANVYSFWERDPYAYERVNVDGTRIVMECALDARVRKIVHVSSTVVWGAPGRNPFDETTPLPREWPSAYGRSKHEGDRVVDALRARHGLPVVTVHPAAILGAGDPKANAAYLGGVITGRIPGRVRDEFVQSWVDVRDVAEGIVRALEHEGNEGERYILAGEAVSFGELLRRAARLSGRRLPPPLPDAVLPATAAALTWIADRTGRAPLWGFARDAERSTRRSAWADASKSVRELGMRYTPIDVALEEVIREALAGRPGA